MFSLTYNVNFSTNTKSTNYRRHFYPVAFDQVSCLLNNLVIVVPFPCINKSVLCGVNPIFVKMEEKIDFFEVKSPIKS